MNEKKIHQTLIKLHITPDTKGYHVLKYALMHPEYSTYSGKQLYTNIARELNDSYSKIERAVRYIMLRVPTDMLIKITGTNDPTALTFIMSLREAVKYGILDEEG